MKIANLKISNHYILGNIELNFCDASGQPFDSIILAGENGSGKSTILEILFHCTVLSPTPEISKLTLDYTLVLDDQDVKQLEAIYPNEFQNGILGNAIRIVRNHSERNWSQFGVTFKDKLQNEKPFHVGALNEILPTKLKSIYSDVAINFKSRDIQTVTAKNIDEGNLSQVRSEETLATEITQLFVDISSSDAQDLTDWIREHPKQVPPQILIDSRMNRFIKAYESMFPSRKFKGIETIGGRKNVVFSENGKFINLSNFSSGEKQIIFRGAFLLRDKVNTNGAFILIDEPEISLHPRWQLKILNYYKDLFKNESGIQTSQIFFATHSPFIIHNESRYNDKVIIVEKGTDSNCLVRDSNVEFPNWTTDEIVKDAFKIDELKTIRKNTVFVEGETDEEYFQKTIDIHNLKLSFEVKWIGKKLGNGSTVFTGKNALNDMKNAITAHPEILHSKVVLFYDNDCNKQNEDFKNLKIRSAPKENINEFYKTGTESLLVLPENFSKVSFEKLIEEKDRDKKIIVPDKRKICDWVKASPDSEKILGKLKEILLALNKEFS